MSPHAQDEVWRGLYARRIFRRLRSKVVIAVSEDIDPASVDAVLWSLAYRTNPIEDVHIVPFRAICRARNMGCAKRIRVC